MKKKVSMVSLALILIFCQASIGLCKDLPKDMFINETELVLIHEVQGSSAVSPIVNQNVTIEGIVVGDFQEEDQLKGFFIQEEDSDADGNGETSEGIFVYDTAYAVATGDKVRLSGTVGEYYDNTQISQLTDLTILSSGNHLPGVTVITLPASDSTHMERYEGMLASFPQSLTVTENYHLGRYGELVLSNGRLWNPTHMTSPGIESNALQAQNDLNRIVLDDGAAHQNPDPIHYPAPGLSADHTVRVGDHIEKLTGVIYYSYGSYRVLPTEQPNFIPTNFRQVTPESVGGYLKVASFNVLNYFTTLDGPDCPYSGGCRGADNVFEFERQRDKIIAAMTAINADIFGLMEVENHLSDEPLKDLIHGLNQALGKNTYAYIPTGAIGTDAIKVALIYKTSSVVPVGGVAILDETVDPRFVDTKNRPSLAQTFMEAATGERATIVVNHLKSKGSNCDALGDPDMGDGQGNCNRTRTEAAQALVDWLEGDPTQSDDPDILVIGDMNAYANEDPITEFKNSGYINLIDGFAGQNAYSYVFYGQAGYLDHALANPSMAGQVEGVTEWHINCDEPRVLDYNTEYKSENQLTALYAPTAYRASDHDPVIIGLKLSSAQTSTQCAHLGDNASRWFWDLDLFTFQGHKGDGITIELAADPSNQDAEGKPAWLKVAGATPGGPFVKKVREKLPLRIQIDLPADGKYFVTVSQLPRLKRRKRGFKGAYCLSLTAKSDLALKPVVLGEQ